MYEYPETLYVLKLKTPDHWYVGTTSRAWFRSHEEHLEGWGAKWTTKHGVDRVHKIWKLRPGASPSRTENEVVLFYMRHVAKDWRNVKGGGGLPLVEAGGRPRPLAELLGPRGVRGPTAHRLLLGAAADVAPLHACAVPELHLQGVGPVDFRLGFGRFEHSD